MNAMVRWNFVVLATLLGLTFAMPASAQWKWRDKNGQTQYSDLAPPAGTPDHDILQRPGTGPRHAAPMRRRHLLHPAQIDGVVDMPQFVDIAGQRRDRA